MKLVIIGGVAGGATAAARARRLSEKAEIVLLERGEFISFANCGLPYYLGGVIPKREDLLVTTARAFNRRYNVDVRTFSEALSIDRTGKRVEVLDLQTGQKYFDSYDKLILSPGARPIRPALPGLDLPNVFGVRNIPDIDRIKEYVDQSRPRSAVVVGGGFIGLEMAENLALRGVETTVVEMLDQVMPPLDRDLAGLVHGHLKDKGVTLALGDGVAGFAAGDGRLVVSTRGGRELVGDLVVLAIGVTPESDLARAAGLRLNQRGGIVVDATLRTSDPDIYAVGDAVEIRDLVTGQPAMIALAGPANKQARLAADNALGRRSIYKGGLGSAVVKVFDLTVALTGLSQKQALAQGLPHLVSHTYSGAHAGYYPGARIMAVKLVFAPADGRLLGAQIVGFEGVDKRIDVLATAIQARMTVFDLEELDLSYAPPYSSAKDPVNIAGFVAGNILKGDVETVQVADLAGLDPEKHVVLDVRTKKELDEIGSVPGAVNVPLEQLRDWLDELDKSKTYVTYCLVGLRSYLAYRILTQNGFKARNLSGGYRSYLASKDVLLK